MLLPKIRLLSWGLLLLCSSSSTATANAARHHDQNSDDDFVDMRFRQAMKDAIQTVKMILDTTRNPRLAENVDHTYDDKFALAEFMTNTVVAAQMNALEGWLNGFPLDVIQAVWDKVHQEKRSVTLRFEAEESCQLSKEEEINVVTGTTETETQESEVTIESDGSWFGTKELDKEKTKKKKTTISKNVKQFHWNVGLAVRLSLFFGSEPQKSIVLQAQDSSTTVITSGGASNLAKDRPPPPFPDKKVHPTLDINLTWLIQTMSRDKVAQFSVDRFSDEASKTCKTPRRNKDINDAVNFLSDLRYWANRVVSFFESRAAKLEVTASSNGHRERFNSYFNLANSLFRPILPLLENATVLSELDLGALLDEQSQRIDRATKKVQSVYNSHEDQVIEAKIAMICYHIKDLANQYIDSINYIEHLLERQLFQAIGKKITEDDFHTFIVSYYQKLFGPVYVPKVFAYAVRRPDHYPDGQVSIETVNAMGKSEPVETWVRHTSDATTSQPIYIPINAATSVEIRGDVFLHGWMQHRFESSTSRQDSFRLAARAHQFSSFLLVVGSMAGPNKFKPKNAIILQNKDEVMIPLLTEVIPTAQEFKDTIASLSPEQQAFAKAFRAMQLESSVFGVCVIQLKPQLEKLLGLPPDSLTKEIQLAQDLMTLFIEYQIPSDLLSINDGLPDNNGTKKLESVRSNVKAVNDIINRAKEELLREEQRKASMKSARIGPTPGTTPRPPSTSEPTRGPPARPLETKPTHKQTGDDSKTFPPSSREKARSTLAGDDFTLIPKLLDSKIEKYDREGSLRSTVIKPGDIWERTRQENLLLQSQKETILQQAIEMEHKKAFDLLDALSRSGSLPIDATELHVVVAVSHCFEDDIVKTIIQANINPIEKVEKSALLIASTIHGDAIGKLVGHGDTAERLARTFPAMFEISKEEMTGQKES